MRTLLYEAANVMLTRYKGQLKLKDWAFAIAKRSTMRKAQGRSGSPPRDHHARDAARRDGVRTGLSLRSLRNRRPKPAPERSDARGREQTTAPILLHAANPLADCGFNLAAPHPAYPIKRRPSAQRTQASQGVENQKSLALDPLENNIDVKPLLRIASANVAKRSESTPTAVPLLQRNPRLLHDFELNWTAGFMLDNRRSFFDSRDVVDAKADEIAAAQPCCSIARLNSTRSRLRSSI